VKTIFCAALLILVLISNSSRR